MVLIKKVFWVVFTTVFQQRGNKKKCINSSFTEMGMNYNDIPDKVGDLNGKSIYHTQKKSYFIEKPNEYFKY